MHGARRVNSNFQVITTPPPPPSPPKKNLLIFSCGHWPCAIFNLVSYSLYKQVVLILILIDVQYLQNVLFSFENGRNGQTQSFLDFHHQIKKSLVAKFTMFHKWTLLIRWYQKFFLQNYTVSLLFKSNWLVEVTVLLTRFNKRRFFPWNTKNTDRYGVRPKHKPPLTLRRKRVT